METTVMTIANPIVTGFYLAIGIGLCSFVTGLITLVIVRIIKLLFR